MEQDQFQQQLERIFDGMDCHVPTRTRPVDDLSRGRRRWWFLGALHMGVVALSALLFVVLAGDSFEGRFFGAAAALMFLVVVLVAFHFHNEPRKKAPRDLADRMLGWLEGCFRQGGVLLSQEAGFINDLAAKNPRVRQACIRWAAESPVATLTTREFRCLLKTNARMGRLLAQFGKSAAARQRASEIRSLLNQSQMLDEASTLRERNLIEQQTPEVEQPSPRRTL